MAVTSSISVVGGNLFAIALTQLGDATQAVRLAQLNNLTDWFLPDGLVTTLLVPQVNPNATGGIPQQ